VSSRALDDPALEARRLAALAQIRQYGDPALRMPAAPITTFDEALMEDVKRMVLIMHDARGVGLAAPQIGSLRRLLVVRPEENGPVTALCNPRIVWRSDEEETDVEGCLSIGELTVDVARSVAVHVEAQGLEGEPMRIEAEGFEARVLQHEMDHLDGVLIVDRTSVEQRREALKALRTGQA
jgi:peptide deformylase